MRILLATPYLAPNGGGLERYADALADALTRQGHEVTQVGFGERPRYEYERGWRRIHVDPAFRVSNTPVGLGVYREVRKLLREEEFDVVNGHTPVPGVAEAAAFAAMRERVPYVVTYHAGRLAGGSPALDAVAAVHRATVERFVLSRAAGRIAVSPYVQEHALVGRPSTVVPPGVDTERFREDAPSVPGRILFVGPVSRAYAWKGFATLFDAFTELAGRSSRAHLRVVGTGDLVESYQSRARELGFGERVCFAGRIADEDLAREYSLAETVVLPSVSDAESFGMVLAEANACSRPVVGSDVGGIPSFVRDGENGLLVPPGDAGALASTLEKVLHNRRLAREMGQAGAARVRKEHRWDDLAAQTAAVYAQAAATARPRARAKPRGAPRSA